MNHRWTDTIAAAGQRPLLAVVLACAATAGMATAVVGSLAGYRAVYYIAVFGLIVAGGIVAATRREPLRFVFLALIACFPVAYAAVPPGRLGYTVFDVVMVALMIGLIGRRAFASPPAAAPLFPGTSLLLAWLLCIPCVVFSVFPLLSLETYILNFAIYAFFLFALEELGRERGLERLVLLLSIVVLFAAAGLVIDHVLHVNLSLRGANLNQMSYSYGFELYRAGGFFQDPQRAGTFLACMITFLLLLAVRGRFRGMGLRFVVWAAIAAGSAALITTVARAAILACACGSAIALFAFNKSSAPAKLLITGGVIVAAVIFALMPMEMWMSIVPTAVTQRFLQSQVEFGHRLEIWFDTWNMFADQPLAGIGLGSFKAYLMKTQPTVFNFYGLGEAAGVTYVPDQPESGYFKILYEGGIAGSLAALLVVGDALRRAIGVIAGNQAGPDARTECIAALAALLVFGTTFVTLFTMGDQRIAALFAFLLAVIWHRSLERERAAPKA
jgi:O-antigen ligase